MAHPAAARDPRSFSSTSSVPPVNRSRSGVPVNQQEQKVVESGDGLPVATASPAGSRRHMTDPVCLSLRGTSLPELHRPPAPSQYPNISPQFYIIWCVRAVRLCAEVSLVFSWTYLPKWSALSFFRGVGAVAVWPSQVLSPPWLMLLSAQPGSPRRRPLFGLTI